MSFFYLSKNTQKLVIMCISRDSHAKIFFRVLLLIFYKIGNSIFEIFQICKMYYREKLSYLTVYDNCLY